MGRRDYYIISDCVCSECGMVMPVPRNLGNRRQKNHIKTMWCPKCKEERDMIEVRDIDMLKLDFAAVL